MVTDEDMTPTDMPVKVKLGEFVLMVAQRHKNFLLPNVGTFNAFREYFEDARNLRETSYMTSITHRMWMHHAQDQWWSLMQDVGGNLYLQNCKVLLFVLM
jgi:hypothetical protein